MVPIIQWSFRGHELYYRIWSHIAMRMLLLPDVLDWYECVLMEWNKKIFLAFKYQCSVAIPVLAV